MGNDTQRTPMLVFGLGSVFDGDEIMVFCGERMTTSNDLVTRVKLSLGKLSYHQLDAVDCQVDNESHITLKGNLRSYYLKQIAQAIALKVPGVRTVSNEILVMD